jgi:hypothetical protein
MRPEVRKLLKVIINLSNMYGDARTYLGCIAGGNNRVAFQRALKRARELYAALRGARNKYESLIAQHGDKTHTDVGVKSVAESLSQSPSAQSRSRLSSK